MLLYVAFLLPTLCQNTCINGVQASNITQGTSSIYSICWWYTVSASYKSPLSSITTLQLLHYLDHIHYPSTQPEFVRQCQCRLKHWFHIPDFKISSKLSAPLIKAVSSVLQHPLNLPKNIFQKKKKVCSTRNIKELLSRFFFFFFYQKNTLLMFTLITSQKSTPKGHLEAQDYSYLPTNFTVEASK